ncbi:MAG: phage major capsid protein [bacterium]
MGTTRELIQALYEERMNVREQQKELVNQMEASLDGDTGEDKKKYAELDKKFVSLGERIDYLLTQEEQAKDADAQRERFEKIVRTPSVQADDERATYERLRNWLRAGLPDADNWAPKVITLKMDSGPKVQQDGRIRFEQHDLTKGVATAGAELIPTGFVNQIQEHLVESAGVRRTNAQVFTTTSGENLLVPKTTGHGTATLIAEGGAVLESDPVFAQVTLTAYKYGVLIQVSRELLEDQSDTLLLPYLARAVGTSIGTATGTAYVTGTGVAQPTGIANAPTAGVTGAVGQTLTVTGNNLIDLYHSIITGYRARGFWVMNDLTAAFIRKIRDDTGGTGLGNFLWQQGLQAGAPDTIFGRPVITDPNVAVMGVSAFSIAFGDFSAYFALRDVGTMRFDRSDDFAFSTDLVTFRALVRTDSKQLINGANGAVKFYRNSAT